MLGLAGPMFACSGRKSPASILSATGEGQGDPVRRGPLFSEYVLFFSEMAWRGSASFGPSEVMCCL